MLLKENIPVSYVFGKIKKEVLMVAVYAITVYCIHQYYNFKDVSIPLTVPTILGTIISLLLAFRSNQAYDRWWEARILWGGIVNDCRTFARQILTFVDSSHDGEQKWALKERIIRRQMAWCYSLSCHLRGQNAKDNLEAYLTDDDVKNIKKLDHIPLAINELQGHDLRTLYKLGWINEYQQVTLDNTLTNFMNLMGGCERIKNTVFPVTYSVYIHWLVMFFVLLLPFSLMEFFGIFQVPLVIAISSAFFLIEKMAIHLQDPFENKPTDTPTTTISRTIEKNLKQMMKDELPHDIDAVISKQPQKQTQFYIL
ncbi:bestrophin family protein [Mucilaginibacter sp. OK283]|jgi:putative membrane protein|uniref:bestrophin family protein n=1 Tax=Mucilaginibacter sp. OK283 TaxID=1881049 RepID=UPI0008CDBF33|nr:bestrophin family ion channel [Mucilaginibacter sp. OK283]SEP42668.1 putative membrane protein [Mucilaginibacter sp. OK283]